MSLGCFGYTLPAGIGIIILMRVIHGAGFAVNSTAVTALTAEKIPMSKMGEGIGYMGLANVIASAAAPGIGISISEVLGYKAVFYISGILGLVTMAIFCTFREKGKPRIHLKKKLEFSDILAVDVLGYTLIGGIFSFTNGVISAYLLMYAQAMGIVNVGLYFTVNAVVMFLIRPAAGKLMDRHGLYVVAFPGLVVTAASMILLAQAGSFGSLALGIIIISGMIRAVGQGAVNPALQTQCIHKLGIAKSGVATSTFYLGGDIGQGLGPMAAGAMIGTNDKDPASYKKVFYMCTVLLIAAVFILMRVKKKDIQNDKKSR